MAGSEPKPGGVLPVIKPKGPTSHDIVDAVRKSLGTRQVGHTGTLDPAASGLLLLCVGPYTKLVPYLTECDKVYRGLIGLGIETDTDDSEGVPTLAVGGAEVTLERVRAAAARFVGEIEQMPPRYSAIKVGGRKLYEYARKGEEIEVEPRRVHVKRFDIDGVESAPVPARVCEQAREAESPLAGDLERVALSAARFECHTSVGTYVRSLARDLGRDLGCGGFLLELERSGIGSFGLEGAVPLRTVMTDPEATLAAVVRGIEAIDTERYARLDLIGGFRSRLERGQPLTERMMENEQEAGAVPSGAVCAVAGPRGELLAMVEAERFETQRRENPYDSKFEVHFRPLRVFPGGLR